MRIAILSRDRTRYSTRRLHEAAVARGHEALIVDYLRCYMNIATGKPQVIDNGEHLQVDTVVPTSEQRTPSTEPPSSGRWK